MSAVPRPASGACRRLMPSALVCPPRGTPTAGACRLGRLTCGNVRRRANGGTGTHPPAGVASVAGSCVSGTGGGLCRVPASASFVALFRPCIPVRWGEGGGMGDFVPHHCLRFSVAVRGMARSGRCGWLRARSPLCLLNARHRQGDGCGVGGCRRLVRQGENRTAHNSYTRIVFRYMRENGRIFATGSLLLTIGR